MRLLLAALLIAPLPALAQDDLPLLVFSTAPSDYRDIAQDFLSAQSGEKIPGENIEIAVIDLDMDGFSEIFAFGYSSWYCGTAGCVPVLLREGVSGWEEIPFGADDFMNSGPAVWNSPPVLENYSRVLHLELGEQTGDFVYDGEAYVRRR